MKHECLEGSVERITYHNEETGWSVLKVAPLNAPLVTITVLVHQAQVFAGSSMEFWGTWVMHPKHGNQFRAERALEKQPASSAALEKYLGSGLIRGIGIKTAKKIVAQFGERTFDVFNHQSQELLKVQGITQKKLIAIQNAWQEHQSIHDVMLFLQSYAISTLFAVKIFKTYGKRAIEIVSQNPYQLARDIDGIGFLSADKIALRLGFPLTGDKRLMAGIQHVLSGAREDGHCYLTENQIIERACELLDVSEADAINRLLASLLAEKAIYALNLTPQMEFPIYGYYAPSLFFDERTVAEKIAKMAFGKTTTPPEALITDFCLQQSFTLSQEQRSAVFGILGASFSILTGGPGCGKTTITRILAHVALAQHKRLMLAAPTGRAAQRMSEVIGKEAKTIHRLLEVQPQRGFKKNEDNPLEVDFLIIDECSMLDVHLAAALIRAVPIHAQILWVGDPNQLPSVGAGNVLFDLLASPHVRSFCLTEIFRQAKESLIIQYAHDINAGKVPDVPSPLADPSLFEKKASCMMIDAEEATREQINFLQKSRSLLRKVSLGIDHTIAEQTLSYQEGALTWKPSDAHAPIFLVPKKFEHVDLLSIDLSAADITNMRAIMKSVHPCSALHYGISAQDMIVRLLSKTITEHFGPLETQVLSPQIRGSLGTHALNTVIQKHINPERSGIKQLVLGERILREQDRVIQVKNNYDLGVFNGDIGSIVSLDPEEKKAVITYGQTAITYTADDLHEVHLAYAITIHKSQGSEFDAIIVPVATQHYTMLHRNLIYTAITRAKKLCILVGSRKALALAVKQKDQRKRQTALTQRLHEAVMRIHV